MIAHGRIVVRVLATALIGFGWGGCNDIALWEPQPQQQPRPAGRPAGRVVEQSSRAPDAPGAAPAEATPAAAPPSAATASPQAAPASAAPTASRSPVHIYQLVLFSEAAPAEAPPGMKHVRLSQARARDVAGALKVLYLPSGPSGTDHRYTLVYPTPLEQDLAAEAAKQLDVALLVNVPEDDQSAEVWRWGVAEAFKVLSDAPIPPHRVRRIAESLARSSASAQLPRLERWAAGMLAGELLAHRLYDYAAAQAIYQQLEVVPEPGSYEQMALVYARGRALQQDGRRDQARVAYEHVIGQFTALRGSEVFERARDSLAQWDRRR